MKERAYIAGLLNHYTPENADHSNCMLSLQKIQEVTNTFSSTMRSLVSMTCMATRRLTDLLHKTPF